MIKREANFQTVFNQYLRAKKLYGHFELKQTSGNSIPFSDVKLHQVEGLLAAQENGFVWKLSDEDSRQKPFDCISTPPTLSYVVFKYPGVFYIISILGMIQERIDNKRKSLTKERAKAICLYEVLL